MNRIGVSVLGATGMVGQNLLDLLHSHPWFEVIDLAASERSAGLRFEKSVEGRWHRPTDIPERLRDLVVRDVNDFNSIPDLVTCVFSAVDMGDKRTTQELEFEYAKRGYAVISTDSANRQVDDVPLIIPEINPHHMEVIDIQQTNRRLPKTGFVAVNPNCSIQSYIVVLDALKKANHPVEIVQVTTLQALSGAGLKGLSSPELRDNVVPFISGEERKSEEEPLKIFGTVTERGIAPSTDIKINAVCTRVPVIDGHTGVVHIKFSKKAPTLERFKSILTEYRSRPQELDLPSAPKFPIVVRDEENRPQPTLDRNNQDGMAVTVGRISKDRFFDIRFIGLSHNTLRGASGGAILMAELLVDSDYIS